MKMYQIIFLLTIAIIEAKVKIFITDSPITQLAGRLYKKELLTDSYSDPKELSYDPATRNLFFMYMDDVIQNSGRAFVNSETKQSMKIKGIELNKATAVESETGDVYFGSENGLYKYDPLSKEAYRLGLYNVNVLKLVARDKELYLIDANNHMIYKLQDNCTVAVRMGNWKTVMDFDVDYEGNVHFVSMCGVYCAVEGHETVKNSDLRVVYNFMVARDGVTALTENGIYRLNCRNGTAVRIGDIDFVPRSFILGENGDIFYSIESSIFRLKPINHYYVYNLHRKDNN